MAITAEQLVVDGKEIPNVKELKGLPADEKKRNSALQSIGNTAKRKGTILVRRGGRAFIAKDEAAKQKVKEVIPSSRTSKYDELVSF